MDDHHLALTVPGPSDMSELEHSLNMPLQYSPQVILANSQGRKDLLSETHATGKDPLFWWYTRNDGPWHAPGLTSGTDDGSGGHPLVSDMGGNQYIVPVRPGIVPSEFMPQSDSGYGSYHNRRSIANGSVCDEPFEHNIDTQSIMDESMADAHFPLPEIMANSAASMGGSWDQITIEATIMKCEYCYKPVKTKSELKFVLPAILDPLFPMRGLH